VVSAVTRVHSTRSRPGNQALSAKEAITACVRRRRARELAPRPASVAQRVACSRDRLAASREATQKLLSRRRRLPYGDWGVHHRLGGARELTLLVGLGLLGSHMGLMHGGWHTFSSVRVGDGPRLGACARGGAVAVERVLAGLVRLRFVGAPVENQLHEELQQRRA
jgi:hypothetical protein